jgi:hypothetical protein
MRILTVLVTGLLLVVAMVPHRLGAHTRNGQRMIGFHIDMNMAQYQAGYLKTWLTDLAAMGYNTIVWELEDGIEWETIPEARQPDALSKETFRDVLTHARALGLENIPLLQTLGHAEYVLQNEEYAYLRANPEDTTQYNPFHPEVVPLMHTWIAEYLDLFGEIRYFHIGADEARQLGFVAESEWNKGGLSVSQIFVRHINAVSRPLIEKDITPVIWADMVLHHYSAIDELSRDVMLFDWMYDIWRGNGKVFFWGDNRGLRTRDQFTRENREVFGEYLFPAGDAPGVDPETFYTADFLADKGFGVVTCPGSSSYGDNVFSPRHERHLRNTWDSAEKGLTTPALKGTVLTSWSVHLHPWELQHAQISAVGYRAQDPSRTLDDFRAWYTDRTYGLKDNGFWEAVEGLSEPCLFTYTRSLGFGKACLPVRENHVEKTVAKIIQDGDLEKELQRARKRIEEYRHSLALIRALQEDAVKGGKTLALWELAARTLVNRAEASELILLTRAAGYDTEGQREHARKLLDEMRGLRAEYEEVYSGMIRGSRRTLMIGYMFDAVVTKLARLAGE